VTDYTAFVAVIAALLRAELNARRATAPTPDLESHRLSPHCLQPALLDGGRGLFYLARLEALSE
jgi:hypothetical protein